jgi:lysophospholipase L1-like esterase
MNAQRQPRGLISALHNAPAKPAWRGLAAAALGLFACAYALNAAPEPGPPPDPPDEAEFPYIYHTTEPQKTGWPLTMEERAYVSSPEYQRRPGSERNQHLPAMWPVTPSAGYRGGSAWLDEHAALIKEVRANRGPIDVLLIGDGITAQWGAAWRKHFGGYRCVNLGLRGDMTQNLLWRIDHGGVQGLSPRLIIVQAGGQNLLFAPETGIEPIAQGIKVLVENLRKKFPSAALVVMKPLPSGLPGTPFYEDARKVNAALDRMMPDSDPALRVLDLWQTMVNPDGSLKAGLFQPDNWHLTQEGGYQIMAAKLKPVMEELLARSPAAVGTDQRIAQEPAPHGRPSGIEYPYSPYNEGKMDPELVGWPLTEAGRSYVMKPEYLRKPGAEVTKHLPDMWPVTPTAGHSGTAKRNTWLDDHAKLVDHARSANPQIVLIGDGFIQSFGASPLSPESAAWNKAWIAHMEGYSAANLGLTGDRTENILWRLDHGALDGSSVKVIVLQVGNRNLELCPPANGVSVNAIAQGIQLCALNIRSRFPDAHLVVVMIFPSFDKADPKHAAAKSVNTLLGGLLTKDPKLHFLDLWADFSHPDESPRKECFYGPAHLSPAGYDIYAARLRKIVEPLIEE